MSEEAVSGFMPAGPLVAPSGVVRMLSERIEELCEDIARLHAGACGCDENDDTMQVYCIAFKLGLADERGNWLSPTPVSTGTTCAAQRTSDER